MKYDEAYTFLISKLEHGLPSFISYHDVQHTKNVIAATEYLASQEGISGDELTMVKTAALFHDAGFLQSHQEHEALSCKMVQKHLPGFDYTEEQIERICTMIMCTKLPQSASDHLSKLLCDADLYYLGGTEYEANAAKLYSEFKRNGIVRSMPEWELKQADFITNHRYLTNTAKKEREAKKQDNLAMLRSKVTQAMPHHAKASTSEIIQDIFSVLLGVGMAGFALKCFLVPNHFFDGGITGTSLLLHEFYHLPLAAIIVVLNFPLVLMSYYTVGKRFAYRTMLSVIALGICLWLLPDVALTKDKLLISIFGGVFLGIGIGMVMRAGAALDGIEVLALFTLKRTSFTITEIILGLNIMIFTIAAFSYGIETALYSILTYFAATRSIDYVVEGIQAFTGVTIISGKSEVIKYELVNSLGRGITVYKGERGFLPGKFDVSADVDIIFTVITRLELRKLKNLVYEVDPNAFVFANTIKEAAGGVIRRRNAH